MLSLSGADVFLSTYRVPFMLAGLAVNAIGVAIMVRVVHRGRAHLRVLTVQPASKTP